MPLAAQVKLDPKVLLVIRAPLDKLAKPATLALKAQQDLKEIQATQAKRAKLVIKAQPVQLALKAQPVQLV